MINKIGSRFVRFGVSNDAIVRNRGALSFGKVGGTDDVYCGITE